MSIHKHKRKGRPVSCMILTISDTRNAATDKSGNLMIELLEAAGHHIAEREIVPDDRELIRKKIAAASVRQDVDVILTNGGTGIAFRDVTIETVYGLLDKEIPGFGELFRMLSYEEDIGSAAMLSRAIAGVSNHTAIFSTPGSSGAVKLAMKRLILPELTHVVSEIKKDLHE